MKSMIRLRERTGNSYEEEKRFLASQHGKRGNVVEQVIEDRNLLVEDGTPILTEDGFNLIEE